MHIRVQGVVDGGAAAYDDDDDGDDDDGYNYDNYCDISEALDNNTSSSVAYLTFSCAYQCSSMSCRASTLVVL